MGEVKDRRRPWRRFLLALVPLAMLGLTGCQMDVNGQTLPSPWHMDDDVDYFPPGPEFKHAREAAAQQEFAQPEALPPRGP